MFSFPESFRELYRFVQSSPRSVGMGCKWKEAWRGQFSWIKPVAGNHSKVSCSACEKELSCETGVNDLKKHSCKLFIHSCKLFIHSCKLCSCCELYCYTDYLSFPLFLSINPTRYLAILILSSYTSWKKQI